MPSNHERTGWQGKLTALIKQHNHIRSDGRIASLKTQHERSVYLFKFMREIRAMGYKVDPEGVGARHVKAVCEKYEKEGIGAATIQTRISFLRVFSTWIGKKGMIGDIADYFTDPKATKRSYQAITDKSWDVPDIDKYEIIHRLLAQEPYVGHQLLMQDAFGLRRKEAIMLKPYLCEVNGNLHIINGSKGGKERAIPIEDDYQREVMSRAKAFVGKTSNHLGNPKLDLKANLARYSNIVRQYGIKKSGKGALGITGHGLRAGYAMNQMENRGLIPLLRGGTIGQLPPEEERRIRVEVSKLLGYNRPQVTTAYSGPMSKTGLTRLNEAKTRKLAATIEKMKPGGKYRFRVHHAGEDREGHSIIMTYRQITVSEDAGYVFHGEGDGDKLESFALEQVIAIDAME